MAATTSAPPLHPTSPTTGGTRPASRLSPHLGNATSLTIRCLALASATIGFAIALPASASADSDPSALLGQLGIGGNGAVSQAIAQVGTSLCPLFVQPGSQLASTATTASGHGGLGSQLAGGVAGLVIQSQCPNFMTSLANGDFSVLTNAASMLGMATPGASPLSALTGAGSSNPLSSLGIPGA